MHSYLITFEQLLFSNPIHNVTMKYTLLLNQVGINDIQLVGGKNAIDFLPRVGQLSANRKRSPIAWHDDSTVFRRLMADDNFFQGWHFLLASVQKRIKSNGHH